MNFRSSNVTLLLAGLLLSVACREAKPLGATPTPPTGAGTGTAGMTAGMGAGAGMGGMGAAPTMAKATLAGFMGGTVTGTATFTKGAGTDVNLVVALSNCMAGKAYPVHIHAGTSCADAAMQGDHWGPTRGEGIPNVMCTGTTGMSTVTRAATDPTLAWTIGGDAATNVIGHAFVVHSADMPMQRIACGIIQ